MAQVVLIDDWIANHAYEDRWDEKEFLQFVLNHGVEHGFHRERGQHDDLRID